MRSPAVGLKAIGVEPGDVRDVILSHMHYDHCGNYDLFPHARYHLQDIEMAYATGRCMCHAGLRAPFEEDDVVAMVRKLFAGRVVFHDGVDELAPGLSVHHVGGHSKGLQVVRVWTQRGWMVLASDASHFYANMEEGRAFPIMHSHEDTLAGYDTMRKLASRAECDHSGARSAGAAALSGGETGVGRDRGAAGRRARNLNYRHCHCEERSDAAISVRFARAQADRDCRVAALLAMTVGSGTHDWTRKPAWCAIPATSTRRRKPWPRHPRRNRATASAARFPS